MLTQGASSWLNVSKLEVLITNACSTTHAEPNYAKHLEVAEYINTKKANTPRDAAMFIARLANHRNAHIAIRVLALLDTLVQSCGYPLHLQIATKEFLNELVRKFPERPPPFPGPVMSRILDLIQGWKEGICADSRWKEDLGNIRDMHRLLTFKGYRFRDQPRRNVAENTMTIKTPEELESEDREAQSAKLQELIRRGTPRDLAAAQELMKTLAGANPDAQPDYRSQSLAELAKLQSKVVLLNEMLDNVDTEKGERWAKGDAYDQVAGVLKGARPKLQKWVSDAESDDPESLNAFLEANDQINTALARFEAFQNGDFAAVASIPTTIGSGSGADTAATSLIDFDDGSADGPRNGSTGSGNTVDDLMSLFSQQAPLVNNATRPPALSAPFPIAAGSQPQPQFGSIMLPGTPTPSNGSTNGAAARTTSPPSNYGAGPSPSSGFSMGSLTQPQHQSSSSPTSSLQVAPTLGQAQFASMMQPKAQTQIQSTPFDSGLGVPASVGPRSSSLGATTAPSGPAIPPRFRNQTMGADAMGGQRMQPQSQPTAAQGKDPFADLAGLF